jgi:hypothetical protein
LNIKYLKGLLRKKKTGKAWELAYSKLSAVSFFYFPDIDHIAIPGKEKEW